MELVVRRVLAAQEKTNENIATATFKIQTLTLRPPLNEAEVDRYNTYTKELASAAAQLEDALAKYDNEMRGFVSKAKTCHDAFEALPEATKK